MALSFLNVFLFVFFCRYLYSFGQIYAAILVLEASTKVIVTSVNGTRSAFALYIFVPVGRFDNLTAQFALNSIFDDSSHGCISLRSAS